MRLLIIAALLSSQALSACADIEPFSGGRRPSGPVTSSEPYYGVGMGGGGPGSATAIGPGGGGGRSQPIDAPIKQ